MNDTYILDDAGNPKQCELLEWARWFENNRDARRVASDELDSGVRVSTIFLGIDHSFGEGPPLLYETMIFGGPHDEFKERYTTRSQALIGHARAVKLASDKVSA